MTMWKRICACALFTIFSLFGLEFSERGLMKGEYAIIPPANAIIGRPLTPMSVAGVARRTARRCAVGVYYC
jgi:hypothetical protein